MKLSNRKIIENINALRMISQKQLPVKISYFVAKNMAKIERELKIYDQERKKLLEKYAEKDEDGQFIVEDGNIKIADIDNWNRDIKELLDIEVDVKIHKLKLEDLLNANIDITPAELMSIDYMIEEEE